MNRLPLLIISVMVCSCTGKQGTQSRVHPDSINHVVKEYYSQDGRLISKVTLLNGIKDGPAYTYYKDGKLNGVAHYVKGQKEGMEKIFHPTGELYQERTFYKDENHGVEKKYYKSGQLMSQVSYRFSAPGTDLVELTQYGDTIRTYPDLAFRLKRNAQGQVLLEVSFSNLSIDAKYYLGRLVDGKFFDRYAKPMPVKNGVGQCVLGNPTKGQVFYVVGQTTTDLHSPYVIERKYVFSR